MKSSFRVSEALHRMVFRAKRDPESRISKRFWIPAPAPDPIRGSPE
jgi:hypothetical protein